MHQVRFFYHSPVYRYILVQEPPCSLEIRSSIWQAILARPHPDKMRRFERARPNQLWQTDLFTFVLKRQNRRLHLVGFMDDHSRFVVGYGLHASASGALVLE